MTASDFEEILPMDFFNDFEILNWSFQNILHRL